MFLVLVFQRPHVFALRNVSSIYSLVRTAPALFRYQPSSLRTSFPIVLEYQEPESESEVVRPRCSTTMTILAPNFKSSVSRPKLYRRRPGTAASRLQRYRYRVPFIVTPDNPVPSYYQQLVSASLASMYSAKFVCGRSAQCSYKQGPYPKFAGSVQVAYNFGIYEANEWAAPPEAFSQ
jgi:hypothetical protein